MLKVITKEEFEKLPAALVEHYKEVNGKYAPQVEGAVPESELTATKAKLAEFRDNNIQLLKDKEALTGNLKKFDGIDPAEYATLKADKEKLAKKGAKDADDVEALIQRNVSAAVKPLVDELTGLKQERLTLKQQLEAEAVDKLISGVASKAGVDPDCMPSTLDLARKVFKFKDGRVIALNGDSPLYSKEKPDQPLTAEEWLTTGIPKAFFKPSVGGGADGGNTHQGAGARLIKAPDAMTFGKNLEDIASGKAVVAQ
jgi:hypothetical protein